jgi:hypothetical protein
VAPVEADYRACLPSAGGRTVIRGRDRARPNQVSVMTRANPRLKPGSCGPAALGIYPIILDEDGNEVPRAARHPRSSSEVIRNGPGRLPQAKSRDCRLPASLT